MHSGKRFPVRAHPHMLRIVAIATVLGMPAQAAERYYRDTAGLKLSPPGRFLGEVSPEATRDGVYFGVTTDAYGRITRTVRLEDGAPTEQSEFSYQGARPWPDRELDYNHGTPTGTRVFRRNAAGEVVHGESFDASGARTGFWSEAFTANRSEGVAFTGDGKPSSDWTAYYAPGGARTRLVSHNAGSNRTDETDYDEKGLVKSERILENGALISTQRYSYDYNDDLVRNDIYDNRGVWYGADSYDHDRMAKKQYKLADGTTEEVDYIYDAKGWAESAQQYVNGNLVCSFRYEHHADGTMKRTLATGPDGTLWGEYPDIQVFIVDQTGHVFGRANLGTILKDGNWW